MQLSSEDSLRLNVLVHNAEAVRIDENSLTVFGLQGEREMKVPLNPNTRSDKYLNQVREMLSGAVLDSPGGYPIFLRRWTRMGQIDHDQMDKLLMLGEMEAVMAVVCSPGLTDDLARKAWWCAPYSEYARRMLTNPRVVAGHMGKVLAEHLVEHLPFETEHRDMLDTVRLVLQGGLIDEAQKKKLWDSGRTKKTYRVGFLETLPDELPETQAARADLERYRASLGDMPDNPCACLLLKTLTEKGQSFIHVAEDILKRPADQDVVSALLNAIGRYFGSIRRHDEALREIEAVIAVADRLLEQPETDLAAVLKAVPDLRGELRALLILAHIDESVVIPVFAISDAIGSLMRKKIEHITRPLFEQFAVLRDVSSQ